MKTLVIGLDCAAPELLFGDEKLVNIRQLMEIGCFGKLESVIPPITIPAWMCMAASQDPGSLGVYGFRNRADYSYDGLSFANTRSFQELTIWDQIAREGGKSIVMSVPPSYPPRKMNGINVGCFMTPDTENNVYTHPPEIQAEIAKIVGKYDVDVTEYRTDKKEQLKDEIYEMSRKHFAVIRHFMQTQEWDYFQFVEIGLDRMQHGFWHFQDKKHILYEKANPYENTLRDYYRYLDEEIGEVLSLLDDDTTVLVMSDHGAKRLDGGFCVNQWLIDEGLLVLNHYPDEITPFGKLDINWEKTKVWSEGGYYARVFFNVEGREPSGIIPKASYESYRDEVKQMFDELPDENGKNLGNLVFKPEEIYKDVRNVAPDLIVHFGDLYWRSIGSVGHPGIHIQENDTGPDGCNHAQLGSFIMAAPNSPLFGEVEGAHILNITPTLLELGGYDKAPSMQGTSMVYGMAMEALQSGDLSEQDEDIIRERLSGLGYIS